MIYRLIVYFLLFPLLNFGQKTTDYNRDSGTSNNIADCFGAIEIKPNFSSNVQLIGNGGEFDDFISTESFLGGKELNSLWFSCQTKTPGFLSITLEKVDFSFNYVAFLVDNTESCESIHNGSIVPIQKGQVNKKSILTFLLDSIRVEADQNLIICINSHLTTKSEFALISSFGDQVTEADIEAMKKVHDFRDDGSEKAFKIKIRDASSTLPLVAKVIVLGTKRNNALYMVSDFIFPYAEQLRLNLKIDVEGYFFEDREINLRQIEGDELVINMNPIHLNQSIVLEGLQFVSQTDVLLPSAYTKLRRLRDFMALNPSVEIEIQGHVHQFGKNTWRAKSLSKKRAKKVRRYLIGAGIRKSRMSVVGLGNESMKFPEAETEAEIQANRRVEIRIK